MLHLGKYYISANVGILQIFKNLDPISEGI